MTKDKKKEIEKVIVIGEEKEVQKKKRKKEIEREVERENRKMDRKREKRVRKTLSLLAYQNVCICQNSSPSWRMQKEN